MKQKNQLIRAAVIAGVFFLFPALSFAGPSVEVPVAKYEFDAVAEGTHVEHSFAIKNTGDAPLHIQKVHAG